MPSLLLNFRHLRIPTLPLYDHETYDIFCGVNRPLNLDKKLEHEVVAAFACTGEKS
jgi:hypothetical protein